MVISPINSRYGAYEHSYVTRDPLLVEEVERLLLYPLGGGPGSYPKPYKPYLNLKML